MKLTDDMIDALHDYNSCPTMFYDFMHTNENMQCRMHGYDNIYTNTHTSNQIT